MNGLPQIRNICLLGITSLFFSSVALSQVVDIAAGESRGDPAPVQVAKEGSPYWLFIEIKIENSYPTTVKSRTCGTSLCTYSFRFEQKHRGVWKRVEANENVVLGDTPPSGTREYATGSTVTERLRVHTGGYALYDGRPTRIVILGSSDTNPSRRFEIRTQEFKLPRHLRE